MKIKLNTVKSKMVAGVAAVTLFSGVGFVAANTDAGGALKDWYDGAFGATSGEVAKDVADYGKSKIGALNTEYNGLKTDAASSINITKDTSEGVAKSNINTAKQSHIDAINTQEAKIAAYMDDQFNTLSFVGKGLINTTGNAAFEFAKKDLKSFSDKKGEDALASLETELNIEKGKAVTALELEITTTKGALLEQLKDEKDSTVADLKAAIDAKIIELREKITAEKDRLVAAQQALIVAKAAELELAAKSDLDAVVTSINN